MGQAFTAQFCCSRGRPPDSSGPAAAASSNVVLHGIASADPPSLVSSQKVETDGQQQQQPPPQAQPRPTQAKLVCAGVQASVRHSVFLGDDPRPVWEVYEQEGRCGSGPAGIVFQARERANKRTVALKKVELAATAAGNNTGKALEEFKRCSQVSHPNILRVFTFFTTEAALYVVTELAAHGNIWEYMAKDPERTKEVWISETIAQILSGLIYLHQSSLVHLGVKPSNILVTDQHVSWDPSVPVVLLSDFGMSFLGPVWHTCGPRSSVFAYCAPEFDAGKAGDKTDVYALGVTIFELLCGQKPAVLPSTGGVEDGISRTMSCTKEFVDWTPLQTASSEGRDLVQRMMTEDYEERPTAVQCAVDAWFGANDETAASAGVEDEESVIRLQRLQRRACECTYSKLLMNMMASQLSGDQLQKEREIFAEMDQDGSGAISVQELLGSFHSKGLDEERALAALQYFDIDSSVTLSFNEWIAATTDLEVADSTELKGHIESLFARLDADGNGSIELGELRDRLGARTPEQEQELAVFFAYLDSDSDGKISLAEFEQFWRRLA